MVNHPNRKLTPGRRRFLYLLDRDGAQPRMGLGKVADDCIAAGWVEREFMLVERNGEAFKIEGIRITDAGRAALGGVAPDCKSGT